MADYEELIGAQFTFGDSLDQAQQTFDQFIAKLNESGQNLQIKLDVGNGALDGITQQLDAVKTELSSLSGLWKDVLGGNADAAQDATESIKQSVASAETAFVQAQKTQTEAAQAGAAKRIEIAEAEAKAVRLTQEDLKKKSQVTSEVSRYGSQFLQQELAKVEAEQAAVAEARQRALKSAPSYDANDIIQKELAKVEAAKARQQAEQEKADARYRRDYDAATRHNQQIDSAKAEEEANSGVGGFFHGLRKGISPNGRITPGSIGEFIGQVARFQLAWAAVGEAIKGVNAVISAPFEVLKGGIQYLTEFQERASQLKATLLDHGFFSTDPAENLLLAGKAADSLQEKIDGLADKLNVAPKTIQSAFEFFSGYGGNKLTGNLNESVDLAGYATAALQSQNPQIQSRVVGTQLEKLTSGSLKDSDKLPAALGISAAKLNEMATHARTTHDLLQQIEAAAPGLGDRIGSANERFESLTATAERFWQRLEGMVSKPLFDRISQGLRDLLQWVNDHQDDITSFANNLGDALGRAADSGERFLKQNWSGLKNDMLGVAGAFTLIAGLVADVALHVSSMVAEIGPASKEFDNKDQGFGQYIAGWVNKAIGFSQGGTATEAGRHYYANAADDFKKGQEHFKQADQAKAVAKTMGDAERAADEKLGRFSEAARRLMSGDSSALNFLTKSNPDSSKQGDEATHKYHAGGNIPDGKSTAASPESQITAVRNTYQSQVDAIKKGSQEVRDAVDEDARAFRISLTTAADLKRTSYEHETTELVAAGQKAQAALAAIHGNGKNDTSVKNAKDSFLRTITGNNTGAEAASFKGEQRDSDASTKQNRELGDLKGKGTQSSELDALKYAFDVKEQYHQKQLISDRQFLDDEKAYWDKYYEIQINGAKKMRDSFPENDVLGRQRQQNTIDDLTQKQKNQNDTITRQATVLPYQENARESQDAVERASIGLEQQQYKTDIDRHAGLTNTARRDNADLARAREGYLFAQEQAAQGDLQSTKAQAIAANPSLTPKQISALPAVQEKELKFQTIQAQLIKAQHMDVETQGISKEQASDRLFGDGSLNGHWHGTSSNPLGDAAQTVSSVGNLAQGIEGGVSALYAGYRQSGVGGAVGAGLQQVGQYIPGIGGQIASGVGQAVSMISDLMTKAAQEIGKEVEHAVEKSMEKFSTGQATLNDTLQAVQQQYNTLVSKETGRKGGQQILDTEGVNLQQQIDQLKQQQQQVAVNFADSVVVAGGTNSVAQQWLQTWISVNKEVQQYENAVGNAAGVQLANQYLNEELDQERKSLSDQYNQAQTQAVNDAIQYNQLLLQRNQYEDQYRQQVFSLQSQDSLARRGNPAEETARQISLAKSQYNIQTQQTNYQIDMYKQKVDYEKQIFGLATNTADLYKQALSDQAYQLKEQVAQYQSIVSLLKSITGLTATNGSLNLPGLPFQTPGYGINDGSLNGIPGYGAPGTVDNSVTNITVNVPTGAVQSGDPTTVARTIANEIKYQLRTRGAVPL